MRREFTFRKRTILVIVTALLLADVALAAYSWNLSSAQAARQQLETLKRNRKLLKADIEYAQKIQRDIPSIQKACDAYEQSMFPESAGYSSVTSDLSAMATKSGLHLQSYAFRANDIKGHPLKEVEIDASVSGSYIGVVHFLNALQRSSHVYAVESLAARSEIQNQAARGQLQVRVLVKTYFRAA
jgi:Tfp pilus assembly protein PilO